MAGKKMYPQENLLTTVSQECLISLIGNFTIGALNGHRHFQEVIYERRIVQLVIFPLEPQKHVVLL